MKFSPAIFVIPLLCGISGNVIADKNDKFVVRGHGRFYPEAIAYLNKGYELMEKEDWQGARQCFDAAIRIDAKIWPAYVDRAEVLSRAGKLDLALADCDTAARLRPDFHRTFIVRAGINYSKGRCRESLADLDRVVSLHANDETIALALSKRAWVRANCSDASIRDPKQALVDAKEACRLENWKKASYIGSLASACAANSDYDGAIKYEQQAIDSGKYNPSELRAAQQRLSSYEKHHSH